MEGTEIPPQPLLLHIHNPHAQHSPQIVHFLELMTYMDIHRHQKSISP